MNKEAFFINLFSKSSRHVGDDGALIDGWVYSKDAFFENVHFKREWMTLQQIAKRAMMVNISDAVAMNAKVHYALLSVAIPSSYTKNDLRALHAGFSETATMFDIDIIGGDTLSNHKLDITVTLISKTKKPLRRIGLKSGDLLAYTGDLGRSAKNLRYLFSGMKMHERSKFVDLKLRQEFIAKSVNVLSCGMDISDGLGSDLEKLHSINRVGFRFTKKLKRSLFCSGEEYEMLVGFKRRHLKKVKRLAQQSRTPLTLFAQATRTSYFNRCKAHHF